MHEPIDTISYYNADGLRPKYFAVNGITYQIGDITNVHTEKFAGSFVLRFLCLIEVNGTTHEIYLRYHIHDHQWLLMGGKEDNAFLYTNSRTANKNTKRASG